VDGDGSISVTDLQRSFKAQGRETSTADILDWVRKRDTTGSGAVSFEDFSDHYQ
jgi:Ca2+-binding EF-hand superfamily protein